MNIGSYNRIITIQEPSFAGSDYGDSDTVTWSDIAILTNITAALVQPRRTIGGEGYESNQRVDVTNAVWLIMYPNNYTITSEMRVVYGGKNYYLIRDPEEIGLRQELQLTTEKRDND